MAETKEVSSQLNDKRFMHRGEEDHVDATSFDVSYVTILHELQKTFQWKRVYGNRKALYKEEKAEKFLDTETDEEKQLNALYNNESHIDSLKTPEQIAKRRKLLEKRREQNRPKIDVKEKRAFPDAIRIDEPTKLERLKAAQKHKDHILDL
ncbi:hypothetical protein EIN_469680 [Entamoeba invadens IP1]|uniref:Uncharacterized protein n=1 Tax=Entamoeba invadens IP1 TaxID=370355 RepID=A0A0A1TUM6_ENTIV|nr:hypothetical protein EIN_469680 [Entamoeba invadens IP1]ELP83754.1 hypothetical protein EIN_469680 [Entamoeba invadens IP1]|eukprot:XP_004183100.1 hypothetical protein EIN_469680 [Entamoeba invadens IP1]